MNLLPRASLTIAILGDSDFRELMNEKGGLEAFGLFAALILVGRERYQMGRAVQVSENGVLQPSLQFSDSITHVIDMVRCRRQEFNRSLTAFLRVAEVNGEKPWIYLDETKHLVIRSFFKYNTDSGWGGTRPGAGRKPRFNQDDSEKALESHLEKPSGTGTGSKEETPAPLSRTNVDENTDDDPIAPDEPEPNPVPSNRSPEDRAEVVEAIAILHADLRTRHLGKKLAALHDSGRERCFEGWRWKLAAMVVQGVDPDKMTYPYFFGIARKARENERIGGNGSQRRPLNGHEKAGEFLFDKAGEPQEDSPFVINIRRHEAEVAAAREARIAKGTS